MNAAMLNSSAQVDFDVRYINEHHVRGLVALRDFQIGDVSRICTPNYLIHISHATDAKDMSR